MITQRKRWLALGAIVGAAGLGWASFDLLPLQPDLVVLAFDLTLEGTASLPALDSDAVSWTTRVSVERTNAQEVESRVFEPLVASNGRAERFLGPKASVWPSHSTNAKPYKVSFAFAAVKQAKAQDATKTDSNGLSVTISIKPADGDKVELLPDRDLAVSRTTTADPSSAPGASVTDSIAKAGALVELPAEESTTVDLDLLLSDVTRPVYLFSLPIDLKAFRARAVLPTVIPATYPTGAAGFTVGTVTVTGRASLESLLLTSNGFVARVHPDWSATVEQDGHATWNWRRTLVDVATRFFLALAAILAFAKTVKDLFGKPVSGDRKGQGVAEQLLLHILRTSAVSPPPVAAAVATQAPSPGAGPAPVQSKTSDSTPASNVHA